MSFDIGIVSVIFVVVWLLAEIVWFKIGRSDKGLVDWLVDRLINWFRYERRRKQPIVYACNVNGVVGVVRSEDFDRMLRWLRRRYGGQDIKPMTSERARNMLTLGQLGIRLDLFTHTHPRIFLFSDKNPPKVHRLTGTLDDYCRLVEGCFVEERTFELPPVNGTVKARDRRGNWTVGYGERVATFGEAWRYIHGKRSAPPYEVRHFQNSTAATA